MQNESWYFWWLAKQALEFSYAPPFVFVSLIFIAWIIVASVLEWRTLRSQWPKLLGWGLVQLVFFPAAIFVGVLGENPADPALRHAPFRAAELSLEAVFCLSLAVGAYGVYRLRGSRWVATGSFLLIEWILQGALFLAGMSITGEWL
jgi:hypothetical protein